MFGVAPFLGQVPLAQDFGPRRSSLKEMQESREGAAKGIEELSRKAREQGALTQDQWQEFKLHSYRWNYFNTIIKKVQRTGRYIDPHHWVETWRFQPSPPPPPPPPKAPEERPRVPTGGGITVAPPAPSMPTPSRPFGRCPEGQVEDLATGQCVPAVATPTTQARIPTMPFGGLFSGGGMTYSGPTT